MSKNKKDKKVLELGEEVQKEEEKEQEVKRPAAPSRKIVKRVMSFDVYFQGLMKKNSKILVHHKAPMRKYAELKGLKEGSEEQFDRIFRLY